MNEVKIDVLLFSETTLPNNRDHMVPPATECTHWGVFP